MALSFQTYSRTEMANKIISHARPSADYDRGPATMLWLPLRDRTVTQTVPAAAMTMLMRKRGDADHVHSTVLAAFSDQAGTSRFSFWCGDTALDGKMEMPVYQKHCELAAALALPEYQGEVRTRLLAAHGAHPRNAPCGFWSMQAKGKVCKHLEDFCQALKDHPVVPRLGVLGLLEGLSSEVEALAPMGSTLKASV